jgi:hypothetical protein
LSFARENVTFPRMNYRGKKISMKEQLEEAIEEIGGERLQGAGFERETPEKGISGIVPAAPERSQPHSQWVDSVWLASPYKSPAMEIPSTHPPLLTLHSFSARKQPPNRDANFIRRWND